MKRIFNLMLLGVMLTGLAACPQPPQSTEGDSGGKAGSLAGLQWIKGEPVDPSAAGSDQVVVVEFWATWCPPCRTSIPHLTEVQKRYADRGVTIVGISDEDAATVEPFVEKMGDQMDYRVAIDTDGAAAQAYMDRYGVKSIPHAFVVDRQGEVVWHGHPMDGLEKALDAALQAS